MSYTNTYYPDYEKMYPGVKITPEVLATLRASDRQMRRFESELKTERFEADNEKQVARFIPSREDSYERLVEEDRLQFADEEMSVEDAVEYREMIRYLYQALAQLEVAEQALIRADFFLMKTEAECAKAAGKECILRSEEDHTIQQTQDLLDVLESGPDWLDAFDEQLFSDLVEKIVVVDNEALRFRLLNGLEVTEKIERTQR